LPSPHPLQDVRRQRPTDMHFLPGMLAVDLLHVLDELLALRCELEVRSIPCGAGLALALSSEELGVRVELDHACALLESVAVYDCDLLARLLVDPALDHGPAHAEDTGATDHKCNTQILWIQQRIDLSNIFNKLVVGFEDLGVIILANTNVLAVLST